MVDKHYIYINNPEGSGKKLLIVGGMFTAPADRDPYIEGHFINLIKRFCDKISKNAPTYCTVSSAAWEKDRDMRLYKQQSDFGADVIIFQLGDHTESVGFNKTEFEKSLDLFIDFLDPKRRAGLLILTSFKGSPSDSAVMNYCQEHKIPSLYVGDILTSQEISAKQKIKLIAQAILCIIEKYIRK